MNRRILFFIIFAVIVLGGMFFVFKGEGMKDKSVMESNTVVSVSPTTSTEKSFELTVKAGKLVSGSETLQVTEGDTVTITITSDEAEELHLHGYDKSVDLEPNKPAKLSFVANQAGHFAYELEHAGVEIGALEVQPK